MWAFISPCAFSAAVLQMQALKAWQSPTFLHTNGEAAVAPPWGSSMELIDHKRMGRRHLELQLNHRICGATSADKECDVLLFTQAILQNYPYVQN